MAHNAPGPSPSLMFPPEITCNILGYLLTSDRTIMPVGPHVDAPGRDLRNVAQASSDLCTIAYRSIMALTPFLWRVHAPLGWLNTLKPKRVKLLKHLEIRFITNRYSGWHRLFQKLTREAHSLQILRLWPGQQRGQFTTTLTFDVIFQAGTSQYNVSHLVDHLRHMLSLQVIEFVGPHSIEWLKAVCLDTGCHVKALAVDYAVWFHIVPSTNIVFRGPAPTH